MIATNSEIMRLSKTSLNGKWGIAIGVLAVYFLVFGVILIIPFVNSIAGIILTGPFTLGLCMFYLSISRNKDVKVEQIFYGFKYFLNAFIAYLLICVFTLLWTFLFIIPGFVAAISYSMTFFILADHPELDANTAIKLSKNMMKGNKGQFFMLLLRFWGLSLLCLLTLGIGFFWLMPYMLVTFAKFYDEVKKEYEETNSPIKAS